MGLFEELNKVADSFEFEESINFVELCDKLILVDNDPNMTFEFRNKLNKKIKINNKEYTDILKIFQYPYDLNQMDTKFRIVFVNKNFFEIWSEDIKTFEVLNK